MPLGAEEHAKGQSTVASIQSPSRQLPTPQAGVAHSAPLLVLCLVGSRLLGLRYPNPKSWQIEVYFEPFLSSGQALRAITMHRMVTPPVTHQFGELRLMTFPSQL